MDEALLLKKLNQPEDPWVERKESFHEREVRKTLVAFANSVPEGEPAVLFIGASNRGNHHGIEDADGVQAKVLAQAQQNSYPEIFVQPKVLIVEGCPRPILAVIVPASKNKPHFGGVAWVREGSESKRASERVFKELIASQNEKVRRLQSHGKNRIVLKLISEPSRLSLEYWNCELDAIDAHHIKVRDLGGASCHSIPSEKFIITSIDPGPRITIEAPWQRTEPEIIKELTLSWSISNETNVKSVLIGNSGNYASQLLNHAELAKPIVASLADTSRNPNIRLLLATLDWEIKKRKQHLLPEQKGQIIRNRMKEAMDSCLGWSLYGSLNDKPPVILVDTLIDVICEVSTSLKEAEELLSAFALIYKIHPNLYIENLYRKLNLAHILGY